MSRLVVALLAVLVASIAFAQAPDSADRVVLDQLDAFKRGDFDGAYAYASQSIREQFDRAAFEHMVRGGYPEIAQPASATVDHREARTDGSVYVFARIWGTNGRAVEALYELVPEGATYRINGVVTRPRRDAI